MSEDFSHYDVNTEKFNAFLKDAIKKTKKLGPAFQSIGRGFYKEERSIFKMRGPGGYNDLSRSTKKQKRRKYGFEYPILKATGDLAKSITTNTSPDSIYSIGQTHLKIGTKIPYGIYHQSDRPRSKIPLRKFVFISGRGPGFPGGKVFYGRYERWTRIIQDHIQQVYERNGWTR